MPACGVVCGGGRNKGTCFELHPTACCLCIRIVTERRVLHLQRKNRPSAACRHITGHSTSVRQSNKNESMPKDLETESKPVVPPSSLPGELYSTYSQPSKQNWGDIHKIVSLQIARSIVKTGKKNLEIDIFSTNAFRTLARKYHTSTTSLNMYS